MYLEKSLFFILRGLYVKGKYIKIMTLIYLRKVDAIFEELEGVVDKYYDKIERSKE